MLQPIFNDFQEKRELACLRAIVLFNPDTPGLPIDVLNHVETLREKVYATLEEHCRTRHEKDTSRFAKLLLRLPALRSIGKGNRNVFVITRWRLGHFLEISSNGNEI